MKQAISVTAIIALGAVAMLPAQSGRTSDRTGTIVATAAANGSFTTLAKALGAAGLVGTLEGPGPFTVFAPTDAAFAKLPAGTLEQLLKPENKDQLRRVLTFHVVAGKVTSSEVVKLSSAKAVSGDALRIRARDGAVMVNDARVVTADVAASNGVFHVIDTVMLPPGF